MGRNLARWRERRYRRSLRTVPALILLSLIMWFAGGGGAFWPGWVMLGGGLVIGLRAQRALARPISIDE